MAVQMLTEVKHSSVSCLSRVERLWRMKERGWGGGGLEGAGSCCFPPLQGGSQGRCGLAPELASHL